MSKRVFLDHNATTPLRPEARAAMIDAMDVLGNPSSVHNEGRAAKGVIEKARRQLSDAFGMSGADIVFTSGATEAAALGLAGRDLSASEVEHDAVRAWTKPVLSANSGGLVAVKHPGASALQLANSETGVVQDLPKALAFTDLSQAAGKLPLAFDWLQARMGIISAHKFGGPKGVGALILADGEQVEPHLKGGGQEMGRRAGTENIIGIAGMGAAAEAAARDLADGVWERVSQLRIILEKRLDAISNHSILIGKESRRLPNTICMAVPGWKGETQVMVMDLAGFAISAGSACSSGKVKASQVLTAMGFEPRTASATVRISLGPETTEDEINRFGDAYERELRRQLPRLDGVV